MAQLQDSTFRFTDTAVTPFVVKPYTVNGPASPSSSILYTNPDGVSAVSANTSLILVGRGSPYYGEVIQGNLVYMLEHFSNNKRPKSPVIGQIWYKKIDYTDPSFPSDPTTTGLYVWNGTSWDSIVITGALSPQLDLNNNRIINLGNAIADTDALNRQSADTRYVKAAGGQLTGEFTLTSGNFIAQTGAAISMYDTPSDDYHLVNLLYLNFVNASLEGLINTVDQRVDAANLAIDEFVGAEGGTFTGNITLDSTSTLIAVSTGPALVFGGRLLSNVATPIDPEDVANKDYVDDTAATLQDAIDAVDLSLTGLDTIVSTEYMRLDGATMTGTLNLGTTSDFVLLPGAFAYFGARRLQNVASPLISTDAATRGYVDNKTAKVGRKVTEQTVGGTTTFTVPNFMKFIVNNNKLQVYVNGVKKYAHTHGASTVTFTDTEINGSSNTGLTASTAYAVAVTVDGGSPVTLTVTTLAGITTYNGLVSLLNTQAQLGTVPVLFTLDAYSSTAIQIVATSYAAGAGSSVALSYTVGQVFTVITTSATPVSVAGVAYDYFEVGNPGTLQASITFVTAPSIGEFIEFLLLP